MRPSLFKILVKRAKLFLFGNRDGVGVHFLSLESDGLFLSAKECMENIPEIAKGTIGDSDSSKKLYDAIVGRQSAVAPLRWNAERELFILLNCLVTSIKPDLVMETGVANGITTQAIMSALEANRNDGSLHSFDILPETKSAYTGLGNWHFHLLKPKRADKQILSVSANLPQVDLWVHDSDHGYRWQFFEYRLAHERLRKGGILVSDDIDATTAWVEVTREYFKKSFVIFDHRKFVGVAIK
jgi:predicted O-methyltransferase YrrM